MPNKIGKSRADRRLYIGDQIAECSNTEQLVYGSAFDRGYMVHGDIEREIWDRLFSQSLMNVNATESHLILTEQHLNPIPLFEAQNEIVFEEYGFQSLFLGSGTHFALSNHCARHPEHLIARSPACLVVDLGYSSTHVVPFFDGVKMNVAMRRTNVGGRVLTNHLKELVSYRYFNVMRETFVVNSMKEQACFVSLDPRNDLIRCAPKYDSPFTIEYVMPDYVTHRHGFVRKRGEKLDGTAAQHADEQVVPLCDERFMVPELLFNPREAGIMGECGIVDAIFQSIEAAHSQVRPVLCANILLVGGTAQLPGIRDRVFKEVRARVSEDWDVGVTLADNPASAAWCGASEFGTSSMYQRLRVTRQDYMEHGHKLLRSRFPN